MGRSITRQVVSAGCHRAALAIAIVWACGPGLVTAGSPVRWVSRGPGGGGAFFAPAINPFNTDEIWAGSDMSDLFRSEDFGATWETVDFRLLQGGSEPGRMAFTVNPAVRYALNGSVPMRSTDGGVSWTNIPHDIWSPSVYGLWVDPATTNRLLVADYTTLYLSTDCGNSWRPVYTNAAQLIAGAFWAATNIYVGTRAALLVSTNGGATFAPLPSTGIAAGEELVSFTGARDAAGTTRFFCVTWPTGDVYPGVQGSSYASYQKIYRMDGANGVWLVATNGIGGNQLFSVAMCPTNTLIAYAAGSDGLGQPSVIRTTNGGMAWAQVMRCVDNTNIVTGWSGDDGGAWNWKKWTFGECAMGFAVCPSDPQRAVITDYGFIHVTTNGGAQWRQAYVWQGHENPAGSATSKTNSFCGNGLEDTSCWWMEWFDSNRVFACFTDIRGMLSTNAGRSWMSPMSLSYNSTYVIARHPGSGAIYGAMSSVHDLYAWDTYCEDSRIDAGSGAVMWSTDSGTTWGTFKNLGRPVVCVALDPNNTNRLYAAMAHSVSGGIYRTTNLSAGLSASWAKLAAPPRTQGHPYNIRVLNDGAIVATYSARIASGDFQPSAGVFVSTNDGASWIDRTDPAMQYYTKDLTVDPHDPSQSTWYAGVWGEWGSSADKGGLYRTTNRGLAWTRMMTNLHAVGFAAVHPLNSNELYVTTEDQGLWYSSNRLAAAPAFVQLDYPFRFPSRVFFNPWNTNEIWVSSFGNGLRLGRPAEPVPSLAEVRSSVTGLWMRVAAEPGQRIRVDRSPDMIGQGWVPVNTMLYVESFLEVEAKPDPSWPRQFYRAVIE